ncbi:MAG: Stp1/IreP family PP2C-type Ser/Thr phosphatase [Oscillospiraceae bacterium]
MNSWAITDKGIVRRQNQDAYNAFCDNSTGIAVFLVCDGMGGARAGNVASELAVTVYFEEVKKRIQNEMSLEDLSELMRSSLKTANSAVYDLSRSDPDCAGMGTTIVAASVVGSLASILNVGDSRAYHIFDGKIRQVTRDHSVVEDMIRRGDLTREEAMTHPNKNLITRAVGTTPEVECDIFTFDIADGDHILLCSDGLSNLVAEQEILYEVIHAESIEFCCEKLLGLAIARGAPDNVTIVLFRK